jgi:phosphoglycerate-specific signal transduction histidine kinase
MKLKTYEAALASLKSAEQLTIEQAKQRDRDLRQILEPIRKLQQEIKVLIQAALDLQTQPSDTPPTQANVNVDKGDWADE